MKRNETKQKYNKNNYKQNKRRKQRNRRITSKKKSLFLTLYLFEVNWIQINRVIEYFTLFMSTLSIMSCTVESPTVKISSIDTLCIKYHSKAHLRLLYELCWSRMDRFHLKKSPSKGRFVRYFLFGLTSFIWTVVIFFAILEVHGRRYSQWRQFMTPKMTVR